MWEIFSFSAHLSRSQHLKFCHGNKTGHLVPNIKNTLLKWLGVQYGASTWLTEQAAEQTVDLPSQEGMSFFLDSKINDKTTMKTPREEETHSHKPIFTCQYQSVLMACSRSFTCCALFFFYLWSLFHCAILTVWAVREYTWLSNKELFHKHIFSSSKCFHKNNNKYK